MTFMSQNKYLYRKSTHDTMIQLRQGQCHVSFHIQTAICNLPITALSCAACFILFRRSWYLRFGIVGFTSKDSIGVCVDVEFGRYEWSVICSA